MRSLDLLPAQAGFTCTYCWGARNVGGRPYCTILDRPILWDPHAYFCTEYAITDNGEEVIL